jgi:uncharacterized protein (TIGR02996 family)
MTPEQAFLADIRDSHNDDALRLIYADWLEEQGQPRGELIRLQFQLADLPDQDERRAPLLQRQQTLLADHEEDWLADLPRFPGIRWCWDRGFPWAVNASSLETFQTYAAILFRTVPLQKLSVRLMGPDQIQQLLDIPGVEKLVGLDLSYGGIQSRGARIIAQASLLRGLRTLALGSNGIGSDGVEILANSPHLGNLTSLDASSNGIDSNGATALARSPTLVRLERLNLDTNDLGERGLEELLHSEHRQQWRILNLSYNRLGNVGGRFLEEAGQLQRLRALYLRGNEIGQEFVEAVTRSPHFANLETLNLSRNWIGDRGAAALLGSPHLQCLHSLYLASNRISPAFQQKLLDHFGARVLL